MKYIWFLLGLCLLAGLRASAAINVDLDYASFRQDSATTIWELYYSFPENSVKYQEVKGAFKSEVEFTVVFTSAANSDQTRWIVEHDLDTAQKQSGIALVSQKTFLLSPGQYKIDFRAKDLKDSTNTFHTNFTANVRAFVGGNVLLSDIEPAASIQDQAGVQSPNKNFLKNGLYVIPNPGNEISGEEILLNSYLEIYQAGKYKDGINTVEYRLFDHTNSEVYYFPRKLNPSADAIVEHISLPLPLLPTGAYKYRIRLVCDKDGLLDTAETEKKIYIINPSLPPKLETGFTENQTFAASEFATLTEEQADKEFKKISRMISVYEKEEFEILTTLQAKQRFLFRYWNNIQIDSLADLNHKRMQFKERENYANRYFAWSSAEGWQTDRGSVYLKYGKPTQRDINHSNGDERTYEKWFYSNVQGGVYFYFVDMTETGNFILVHSTAIGEIKDYNWYTQYVRRSSSGNEQNSIDGMNNR